MVIEMLESDDVEFKAEIDKIVKKVNQTMQKIESVVPLKNESEKDDLKNPEKSA